VEHHPAVVGADDVRVAAAGLVAGEGRAHVDEVDTGSSAGAPDAPVSWSALLLR
jgi:hypothetical protein